MIRSASRKFRNRLATSRSCLKSFWKRSAGGGNVDTCLPGPWAARADRHTYVLQHPTGRRGRVRGPVGSRHTSPHRHAGAQTGGPSNTGLTAATVPAGHADRPTVMKEEGPWLCLEGNLLYQGSERRCVQLTTCHRAPHRDRLTCAASRTCPLPSAPTAFLSVENPPRPPLSLESQAPAPGSPPPALCAAASPRGSTFQAMVSVMAVKIQFSSPSGVLLSFSRPGILGDTAHFLSRCGTQRQGAQPHRREPCALPGFLGLTDVDLYLLELTPTFHIQTNAVSSAPSTSGPDPEVTCHSCGFHT